MTLTVINNFLANDPLVSVSCNGTDAGPVITEAAVRQAATRLLPSPAIGTPWPVSLLNFPVLLWLDTPPDRDLPTATVVGVPVRLRIHLVEIDWTFGDHLTATTTDPGIPYRASQPCGPCPGRFAHTFLSPGRQTVAATARWAVQFAAQGQNWSSLPSPVAAPAATRAITIKQARSVLLTGTGASR